MTEDRRIVLVRHGETEWSPGGRHTGRTDVPLTATGREQAEAVGRALGEWTFALVLASPLARAAETCRLAGLACEARPDLEEWDYGAYEGLTTAEIRADRPGWTLWRDGVPGGETAAEVAARADRVLAEAAAASGDVALFSHGHLLRVLCARWLGLPVEDGAFFALAAGSISWLGHEHEARVVERWNTRP